MPINRSIEDLPRGSANSPQPNHWLATFLGDAWEGMYREHESRERALPELPWRASQAGLRCDAQLWYALKGVPESEPPDTTAAFRMWIGKVIHDKLDTAFISAAEGQGLDVKVEVAVDLSGIGFTGSSHADFVMYDGDKVPLMTTDIKTVTGFPFKQRATTYGGDATGAELGAILQSGLSALALDAEYMGVLMISLEPVSVGIAAKNCVPGDLNRFVAVFEWRTEVWRDRILAEIQRFHRIQRLVDEDVLPTPMIDDGELPAGAYVTDPTKGQWQTVDLRTGGVGETGKTWRCEYCRWRSQCANDIERGEHG